MNYSGHNNPAKATNAKAYPIGAVQMTVLLELHKAPIYEPLTARGMSRKAKILNSLVRKGFAVEPAHGRYVITKEGAKRVNAWNRPI